MKKLLIGIILILAVPFLSGYVYFQTTSPEGMSVLTQYILGDGSDYELKSDYLPTSPVIVNNLKTMEIGETRRITFRQKEDWRLSYALNPFNLTKTENGFTINQYIIFDTSGDIYTDINIFGKKIRFHDNWINKLNPTPYTVYYSYSS